MRLPVAKGALIALAISTNPTIAGSHSILQPGAYEVQVRLDLPNLDDITAVKTAEICISAVNAQENSGLTVLSDNNPLAKCPRSNLLADGNELSFDVQCPGGNAARANARYTIGDASFTGRIRMTMGGKNMTMTETQLGRRVGNCAANAPRPKRKEPVRSGEKQRIGVAGTLLP